MQKQYTAISGFPYKTRHLVAGETFEADEKMGVLLVKMGRAKPAKQPTSAVAEPAKTEPEPAPLLAENVVAEPAPLAKHTEAVMAEPEATMSSVPELIGVAEPAKPAFKTRRSYGSRSP